MIKVLKDENITSELAAASLQGYRENVTTRIQSKIMSAKFSSNNKQPYIVVSFYTV